MNRDRERHSDCEEGCSELDKVFKQITKRDWVGKTDEEGNPVFNSRAKGNTQTIGRIYIPRKSVVQEIDEKQVATPSPKKFEKNTRETENNNNNNNSKVIPEANVNVDEKKQQSQKSDSVEKIPTNPMHEIDKYALKITSIGQLKSVSQLINEIRESPYFLNPRQLIRLVCSWICFNDLELVNFHGSEVGSEEIAMTDCIMGNNRYAALFNFLITCIGLNGHLIEGWTYDLSNTKNSSDSQIRSCWNSVFIENAWNLVDCFQAKKALEADNNEISKTLNISDYDFWILPNPSEITYLNFPDDKIWMLIEEPVPPEIITAKPQFWPIYFVHGIQLDGNVMRIIESNEETKITLRFPESLSNRVLFKMNFKFKDGSEKFNQEQLRRFTHTDLYVNQCYCDFFIRPPSVGEYIALIQMKLVSDDPKEANKEAEISYRNLCLFELHCTEIVDNDTIITYPKCKKDAYGPTTFFKCFPMKMNIMDPLISTTSNTLNLKFFPNDNDTNLMIKVKSNNLKDNFDDCIVGKEINDYELDFNLKFLNFGHYGIEISAYNKNVSDEYYKLIWQYFIDYHN